jgi:protein arginine N-methyltransferase 1
MYEVADYGRMIGDEVRTSAYERALLRAVRPDSVVLDLGTGTGILALFACRAGARRVYAVDMNPAVSVGRAIAKANGLADRIEFIQGMSTEIDLPERADVLVCDLHGKLPFLAGALDTLADAHARHLAPNAVVIPARDTLWAAVVEAQAIYDEFIRPWSLFGFDMHAGRDAVVNSTLIADGLGGEQMLTGQATWAAIDYANPPRSGVRGSVSIEARRAGVGHGVTLWFDADLGNGIRISNAPGEEHCYGRILLPWPEPVTMVRGDTVTIELCAIRSAHDPTDFLYGWITTIPGKAQFRQTTFLGDPTASRWLPRERPDAYPRLSAAGSQDVWLMSHMDGSHSISEIAERAVREGVFTDPDDARAHIRRLSHRYPAPDCP